MTIVASGQAIPDRYRGADANEAGAHWECPFIVAAITYLASAGKVSKGSCVPRPSGVKCRKLRGGTVQP